YDTMGRICLQSLWHTHRWGSVRRSGRGLLVAGPPSLAGRHFVLRDQGLQTTRPRACRPTPRLEESPDGAEEARRASPECRPAQTPPTPHSLKNRPRPEATRFRLLSSLSVVDDAHALQQAADSHGLGGGDEAIGRKGVGAVDDDLAVIGQAEPL